jgi:uncharacterized protein (TIGR02300 family)
LTRAAVRATSRANHRTGTVFYVARPELGTKRVCPVTGKKFYDLNQDPIVSPYTGQSYPLSAFGVAPRAGRSGAAAPVAEEEADLVPAGDVEIVSLEEADAEVAGVAPVEEDAEIEEDIAEAEPFLEEEEGGEDDVADLIGDVEDDEET